MMPLHSALVETLGYHFLLSKSRFLTLAVLIAGLVQSRTVNLSHLASHLSGQARFTSKYRVSKYRRLQRFFQFVRLDQVLAARIKNRAIAAWTRKPKIRALVPLSPVLWPQVF